MSKSLADDLPDTTGTKALRVWLESSGYARRLLLGQDGDPWADGAAKYLSFFTQARGLLRSDVAVVNLGDLFRSWIARHPDLATEMGSKKRATYPLRRMLEETGPRALLDEVVEAVAAHLQGQIPLVLAMPAPGAWLAEAQMCAGRPVEVDADTTEDAAMYIADFIRCVAQRPVGGLLLEESETPGAVSAYAPLFNAAKHYRWAVVGRGVSAGQEGSFDAVIGSGDKVQGCDVSAALFGGMDLPKTAPAQFLYAQVPVDHPPEAVLDAVARLQGLPA
ncbi:hypothetical protein [uncultured Celeribacter sp.]|uniref:hypothetical protein n=1 Tax=uncultured Celeribacter sp. TaxID=1303376 RepID=UPI002AA7347C|nr:hypothetical protein [uncultured Celeribacter sp.]